MNAEKRFCEIIMHYCDSLAIFIETIRGPTELAIDRIGMHHIKTKKFDKYISLIENLNTITTDTARLLKSIIFSLNGLFLEKTMEKLISFITAIQTFLNFLTESNIFMKLQYIKTCFDHRYDTMTKFLEKVDKISEIIFNIFNISIAISAIFIPSLSIFVPVLNKIEQQVIQQIDNKLDNNEKEYIEVDNIIKSLLDTQLRSEVIANIKIDVIYDCINDKNSDELLPILETLQSDYLAIAMINLALKSGIENYRKKKGVLNTLFNICDSSKS